MDSDQAEQVLDGSVDLRGKAVVRQKTGGWRACYLIIGYEFVERLAFAGIWGNLVVYLTTQLHESTVSASTSVTNWMGTTWLTPLLGAYIADTYLGRFWTFAVFSCIYILGMGIMTLAVTLKSLRPPDCPSNEGCEKASTLQIGIFYFALYILALGAGGTRPNISTFGADQFDDFDTKEKLQKNTFFNWWIFVVFCGSLIGQTLLVYIQDHVSWGVASAITTTALIISCVVFMIGTPIYRHQVPAGSPMQKMAKVIARTIGNRKVKVPSDSHSLHELDSEEYRLQGRYPLPHTKHLRFMDKAAVRRGSSSKPCPVTEVEETKLVIRILPIWLTTILPTTLLTQSATLFVKQGMTLDKHMGSTFEIPPAAMGAFLLITMLLCLVIYDRVFVPLSRKFTGNPRGITILQRMGIGMIITTIAMVAAIITELERLKVIKRHGLGDKGDAILPMSIFTLLPQFILMGMSQTFVEVARLEFFYDQVPDSMRSIGTALYAASQGVGSFASSFLLTLVNDITGRDGHKSWILDSLNASRIHYYYALLAILSILNYIFFLPLSCMYTYKRESNESLGKDSRRETDIVYSNSKNEDGIDTGV